MPGDWRIGDPPRPVSTAWRRESYTDSRTRPLPPRRRARETLPTRVPGHPLENCIWLNHGPSSPRVVRPGGARDRFVSTGAVGRRADPLDKGAVSVCRGVPWRRGRGRLRAGSTSVTAAPRTWRGVEHAAVPSRRVERGKPTRGGPWLKLMSRITPFHPARRRPLNLAAHSTSRELYRYPKPHDRALGFGSGANLPPTRTRAASRTRLRVFGIVRGPVEGIGSEVRTDRRRLTPVPTPAACRSAVPSPFGPTRTSRRGWTTPRAGGSGRERRQLRHDRDRT